MAGYYTRSYETAEHKKAREVLARAKELETHFILEKVQTDRGVQIIKSRIKKGHEKRVAEIYEQIKAEKRKTKTRV